MSTSKEMLIRVRKLENKQTLIKCELQEIGESIEDLRLRISKKSQQKMSPRLGDIWSVVFAGMRVNLLLVKSNEGRNTGHWVVVAAGNKVSIRKRWSENKVIIPSDIEECFPKPPYDPETAVFIRNISHLSVPECG